jgi:hypothetical protein
MQQPTSSIAERDRGAWCLAALQLAARRDSDDVVLQAATSVLAAGGPTDAIACSPFSPPQLGALAAAPLLKAAALATGRSPSWADRTDETLLVQGRAAGPPVGCSPSLSCRASPRFAARLATPGARMLDVGSGVGALVVGVADAFPQLHATAAAFPGRTGRPGVASTRPPALWTPRARQSTLGDAVEAGAERLHHHLRGSPRPLDDTADRPASHTEDRTVPAISPTPCATSR